MRCLLRLLLVVISCLYALSDLDDSVIAKDLYAILGVKKSASIKQIKKSFRKLARKHHPDKSKPDDAKINEKIFREVAEAYEVLSSPDLRSEYDKKRSYYTGENSSSYGQPSPQYSTQYRPSNFAASEDSSQQDMFDSMFTINSMFEPSFQGSEFPSDFFQPSVVGSVLNTGQIIFPYDPIMTTGDRSTFATLDESCAFVIYQGDLDQYIRTVLMQESTQPTENAALDFDIVYQTEQFPALRGNCFAAMDEAGVFHIFSGHPGMAVSQSIWSTGSPPEYYNAFFERYSMVLTTDGQLTIYQSSRSARYPNIPDKCVWSSTSSTCNAYISAANKATMRTRTILKRHKARLQNIFHRIGQKVVHLGALQMLQKLLMQGHAKLRQVVSRLEHAVTYIVNKLTDCYFKHTARRGSHRNGSGGSDSAGNRRDSRETPGGSASVDSGRKSGKKSRDSRRTAAHKGYA